MRFELFQNGKGTSNSQYFYTTISNMSNGQFSMVVKVIKKRTGKAICMYELVIASQRL